MNPIKSNTRTVPSGGPRPGAPGFTLVELMAVVVIIGVMTGLALPNFFKTMERTHESDAAAQLKSVHAANQIYEARTSGFWPPDGSNYDVSAINSNLNINLVEEGMTYSCSGTDGTTFTCTAVRQAPAASFTVKVTEAALAADNPCCSAGACPGGLPNC